MAIKRREFLTFTASSLALISAGLATAAPRASGWLGCRAKPGSGFYLSRIDTDGSIRWDIGLPARGHGMAAHPIRSEAVVFARRPGEYLIVVDWRSGGIVQQISTPDDRHSYGHGVFSRDGSLLFVAENDFDAARGVIGVYDAMHSYRRLGEFDSHGVGPHELKLLNRSDTLVVANGGIHTHPDMGRSKLNLDTMDPNLAYVDISSGKLLGAFRPPKQWHHLSIRHIDLFPDDTVCAVMQYQGPANVHPPLVAMHRGGEMLQLLSAPHPVQSQMKNYCGSVCCSDSRWFVVSSPRGDLITVWDIERGELVGSARINDGCGIALDHTDSKFVVSDGVGNIVQLDSSLSGALAPFVTTQSRWDNHLLRLG